MAEYIEREAVDAAIKAAADHRKAIGVPGEQAGFLQAHDIVRRLPAADVVEVKHGHWTNERWEGLSSFSAECSECTNRILSSFHYDYCPNCGAKMDGGQDDV